MRTHIDRCENLKCQLAAKVYMCDWYLYEGIKIGATCIISLWRIIDKACRLLCNYHFATEGGNMPLHLTLWFIKLFQKFACSVDIGLMIWDMQFWKVMAPNYEKINDSIVFWISLPQLSPKVPIFVTSPFPSLTRIRTRVPSVSPVKSSSFRIAIDSGPVIGRFDSRGLALSRIAFGARRPVSSRGSGKLVEKTTITH